METRFYDREFTVLDGVLLPRDTSEPMIEMLKELKPSKKSILLDLGCGAGHLGITAVLENLCSVAVLVDNEIEAIKNSGENARKFGVVRRVIVQYENLQDSCVFGQVDIVLANLNFVPQGTELPPDNKEPLSAIYSGETGMELYRDFWKMLEPRNVYVIVKCKREQFEEMDRLATAKGYVLWDRRGFCSAYVISE